MFLNLASHASTRWQFDWRMWSREQLLILKFWQSLKNSMMKDSCQSDRGKTPSKVFLSMFRSRRNPKETQNIPKPKKSKLGPEKDQQRQEKAHGAGSTTSLGWWPMSHSTQSVGQNDPNALAWVIIQVRRSLDLRAWVTWPKLVDQIDPHIKKYFFSS